MFKYFFSNFLAVTVGKTYVFFTKYMLYYCHCKQQR